MKIIRPWGVLITCDMLEENWLCLVLLTRQLRIGPCSHKSLKGSPSVFFHIGRIQLMVSTMSAKYISAKPRMSKKQKKEEVKHYRKMLSDPSGSLTVSNSKGHVDSSCPHVHKCQWAGQWTQINVNNECSCKPPYMFKLKFLYDSVGSVLLYRENMFWLTTQWWTLQNGLIMNLFM